MLSRQSLVRIRSKAIRKGMWYEALSRAERAIVDLTIKCVENVRSPILTRAITKILNKIATTLEKSFSEKAREIGSDLAKHLGVVAEKWGYKNASLWKNDKKFIEFLGVLTLNS